MNKAPKGERIHQKSGPISGAANQKRRKEGSQDRRCKGPPHRPERLIEVESIGEFKLVWPLFLTPEQCTCAAKARQHEKSRLARL
jgi:hypothetical protein